MPYPRLRPWRPVGMSTSEMEPHWEKMPRSSSTVVDHGMLPTYRRLVGSSDAIVTVCVCVRWSGADRSGELGNARSLNRF